MIDGGALGGMSDAHVRVIEITLNKVHGTGLAEHSVVNLPLRTVSGSIVTSSVTTVGIFDQNDC